MTNNYLLPAVYKKIGLWMILPFIAGCIYCLFFGDGHDLSCTVFAIASDGLDHAKWFSLCKGVGILDEICMIGLLVSLVFIAFSREKDEDEFIERIRMQSLVWALMVNAFVLVFGIAFFYEFAFLYFCFIFLFLIYFLFLIKFHCELYRFRKMEEGGKL